MRLPTAPVRSPAPWLLGALAGVAWQLQQAQLWPLAAYAACVAAGLVLAIWAWRAPRGWAVVLLAALLLGWGSTGWRASAFQATGLDPVLEGRDIEVRGRVSSLPQPGPDFVRFRLQVDAAWLDGQPVRLPPELALAWYAPRGAAAQPQDDTESSRHPASLVSGEQWRMTVRLKAPHGGRNPHGFDHELWLWEQGVQAVGYVRNTLREPAPRREQAAGPSVDGLRQAVRSAILAQVPDPGLAGVVAALVMGDQAAIERADWDVFRATGVAHLMSISGLHITLFAWLASRLLRAGWQASARWTPALCLALPAHRAGAWGGLALALAYAVFSGWGLPAQRTAWMLTVAVLLQQSGRRWPWPQVWLLAMGVVVAVDPWALLQAGFWLSFVAVGVLLAMEQGRAAGEPPDAAVKRSMLVRWVSALKSLGREQLIISLALAPLTLMLFQQLSWVGLVANLLAIPWVTWVITPLALLGMLVPPLWSLAALLLQALMAVLTPLSELSWAVWHRPAAPLWCGLAAMLGAGLLVMRWPVHGRLLGLPLCLPLLLWQPLRPPPGEVELLALDVGQGTAVLVRTAHHSLLYDAGPRYSRESDAGHRVVVPVLRALGERLDAVVLSHEDSDHVGGAPAVLQSQPQARVLASFAPAPWGQGRLQPCEAGQRWTWDGVEFEILHPQPGASASRVRPNARSCVLRVRSGGPRPAAALLTGDLEASQEHALLASASVQADWLLVPHHGSRTSSSQAFLEAVVPRVAVAQAGYRNRFGHPAAEVTARYQALGVSLVTTPACGAATWRSQEPGAIACLREQQRRYWHHPGPAVPPARPFGDR